MNLPFHLSGLLSGFILLWSIKKYYQPFFRLSEASLKILNSLLLPEEDSSKIKTVEKNLVKLLGALGIFFLWILLLLMLAAIPIAVYSLIYHIPYSELDLDSWTYILSLSIGSLLPFIRFKKKEKLSYSEVSKLFHRLILDNYQLGKKLFAYDLKKFGKHEALKEEFVIVSGLARAGTTALMLKFNEIKNLKSLDYSNMPLLMAPNLWRKVYSPKSDQQKERAHGDGIQVGLNSAEALEEYFFKLQLADSFIGDEEVEIHEISDLQYQSYLQYQSLILKNKDDIYLAKNNNLILRYQSLRQKNSKFKAIFMFREPISHAFSLLSQHRRYLGSQKSDPFVLEYMDWLGHHEFGLHQKSFALSGDSVLGGDKNSLDYWLMVWKNYYQYLLPFLADPNVFLVDYSDFCSSPKQILQQLTDGIGIDYNCPEIKAFHNDKKIEEAYSKEVFEACHSIFNELLNKKLKINSH